MDPEHSVFHSYYKTGDADLSLDIGSRIEGIGRPRVEPSFMPGVIDEMKTVPDAASVATARWMETILGRKVGASTGTNLYGVLQIAEAMRERGKTGSIVTLLCDSGERYLDTYYNEEWVNTHIGDLSPYTKELQEKFGV